MRRSRLAAALALGALALGPTPAAAQASYPARPIEVIVPWGPGGGADQTARLMAKLLEPRLGVAMPVVNVPGATGVTGLTKLLTAPPDGYAIQLMTADTAGLLATGGGQFSLGDFTPIAIMTQQPSMLIANAGGRFKTWEDVVRIARTEEIKVGLTGFGSPEEVAVNFFTRNGLKLKPIPFPKPSERYAALLGNHIDLLYEQAGDVRGMIEGRQIAPVVVLATERTQQFPEVPTAREVGFDLVEDQWRAVIVRSGVDRKIMERLAKELDAAAQTEEYKKYLDTLMARPDSYVGLDKAGAFVREHVAGLKKLAD